MNEADPETLTGHRVAVPPPDPMRRALGWWGLGAAGAVSAMGLGVWVGPALPTLWRAGLLGVSLLALAGLVTLAVSGWREGRRARAQGAEREQRLRGLLQIAADWYWELDAELRFTQISEGLPAASDRPAGTLLGRHPWDVVDLHGWAEGAQHVDDLKAHRAFNDLVVQRPGRDGRLRCFSVSGRPRFDPQGRFLGYWGIGRDISSEVRAREAHRASEARFRELFALSPTPLVLHRDGVTLLGNDAAARLFGFASGEAMQGFDLAGLYPASQRPRLRERLVALAGSPVGQGLAPAEFDLQALDGRQIHVQATGVRVNSADGPAMLSMYHDESERVRTETALRRSEALLSHLFSISPDFFTLTDLTSGVYVMVNQSFTRILGYSADEVLGRSAVDVGVWYDLEDRRRMVARLQASDDITEVEAVFVHKSGRPVSLLMSARRFSMDGHDYLVINGRDVTDAQRARLEHEAILKNAYIGIALTRDQKFAQANPRFEHMFGWGPGELIGQPGSVVWSSDEAYAEIGRIAGPLLSQAQPVELEREMCRRDGTRFWCRLLAQVVDPAHPRIGGTIWIAEDVTERRQIEQALASARDTAEAANRAKSAFLANTSHEIRTPLNGLLGLANLAMQTDLDAPRRQQYLEQIHDSAQSLAGIISDILDLSKIEAGKLSVEAVPFELHVLLHAVHHAYQSLAHAHSLELRLHIAEGVPATVRGDPLRLRQILSNFITNGLKFTARGHVALEVALSPDPQFAGQVRFTVTDTGPGIDADTQQRLFRPFTQADDSTTRRFGGTGLGLSICKELSTLMGGRVGVDSTLGAGSCFWAEMPLPPCEMPPAAPDAEAQELARLRGLRVLLVEDNPVNMMIGVAMLERWGVSVVQASDGQEALAAVARAEAADRRFDAVLMDVQMPRLSGHEAARALRERHAPHQLPIIALTAAALVSEREEALAAGMTDFLTKPIDAIKLRQALIRAVS